MNRLIRDLWDTATPPGEFAFINGKLFGSTVESQHQNNFS